MFLWDTRCDTLSHAGATVRKWHVCRCATKYAVSTSVLFTYAVVVQDLSHSMDSIVSVQNKKKLLKRRKRVYESFSNRWTEAEKSFTLTTHWNLENPAKICTMESKELHTPPSIRDERYCWKNCYAEQRNLRELMVLQIRHGMQNRWAVALECCCYLRHV